MPRQKNTRPTLIYWLLDVRPETIAAGWSSGQPFYCGKTVYDVGFRLRNHHRAAVLQPHRPISKKLIECGDQVRWQIMETVPANNDWAQRERYWIRLLRHSFPAVNVSDGGDGPTGWIPGAEWRTQMSERMRGKPLHPNTLAAMVLANTGRPKTENELAKIGAAHKGKIVSEETRSKLREANIGKKASVESRAKQSVALKGRKVSPETLEKMRARVCAPETREQIRTTMTGVKHTPERVANISAALMGKKQPPRSPEHSAKISANKKAWWAARRAKSANV